MPAATIAIVTKDRRDELRRALASALAQEGDLEVVVFDDGSRDGTADAVRREFPTVRLERFAASAGLVVRRNQVARVATGPIVVSLDDDAVLTTPGVVAQTLRDFDHPRVAAVAIPFRDAGRSDEVNQRAPSPEGRWVAATFRGTAYAVRRDVFLDLDGFREIIVHQGEEPDFTLRLLARGYVVRLGRADPIHHHESPTRSLERMTVYGRRNELLLAFTYFPLPWSALLMARWLANGLLIGVRLRLLRETFRGVGQGVRICWRLRGERRPLPPEVVAVARRLRRARALPLDDLEPALPALGDGRAP